MVHWYLHWVNVRDAGVGFEGFRYGVVGGVSGTLLRSRLRTAPRMLLARGDETAGAVALGVTRREGERVHGER